MVTQDAIALAILPVMQGRDVVVQAQAVIFCNTRCEVRRQVNLPIRVTEEIVQVEWLAEKMRAASFIVSSMHGEMPQVEHTAIMAESGSETSYVVPRLSVRSHN